MSPILALEESGRPSGGDNERVAGETHEHGAYANAFTDEPRTDRGEEELEA
jgi:hypothetical protein